MKTGSTVLGGGGGGVYIATTRLLHVLYDTYTFCLYSPSLFSLSYVPCSRSQNMHYNNLLGIFCEIIVLLIFHACIITRVLNTTAAAAAERASYE